MGDKMCLKCSKDVCAERNEVRGEDLNSKKRVQTETHRTVKKRSKMDGCLFLWIKLGNFNYI